MSANRRRRSLTALVLGVLTACVVATAQAQNPLAIHRQLAAEPPVGQPDLGREVEPCYPAIVVLRADYQPAGTSGYAGAPATVTTASGATIFSGPVTTTGLIVVGPAPTPISLDVVIGNGGQLPGFSNHVRVPCECSLGGGILQVRSVDLSPAGPSIPTFACAPGQPFVPIILLVDVFSADWTGATAQVLDASNVVIFNGVVGPNGTFVVGVVASGSAFTVDIGPANGNPAFSQSITVAGTCDDGSGILQVAAEHISPTQSYEDPIDCVATEAIPAAGPGGLATLAALLAVAGLVAIYRRRLRRTA